MIKYKDYCYLKKIIYYITDHALGHTTRSVAIIRELIKDGIQVTVRNSNVGYLNKSLPNVNTISGTTDVGPIIEKNGISIFLIAASIKRYKGINLLIYLKD